VVYASIRNEAPFNTEGHIREVFDKFGFVRNIELKTLDEKPYKTFVLVEYETLTQALRARERVRAQRERYLGDRKSEVTLLLDSEKVTRLHPNAKNQIRYYIKRQHNTASGGQPQLPRTINPFLQHTSAEPPKPAQQHIAQPVPEPTVDIINIIREVTEKEHE
jgi:hypothetical protein